MATAAAAPSPAAMVRLAETGQFRELQAMMIEIMRDGRESATVFARLGRVFEGAEQQEIYLRFLGRLLKTDLPTLALVAAYLDSAERVGRLKAAERIVRQRLGEVPRRSWNSGDFLGNYPMARRSRVLTEYKYGAIEPGRHNLLEIADAIADDCTLNIELLDRLYETAGRPADRAGWERGVRAGFAADHACQDKNFLRIEYARDIRPLIDVERFAGMAETVRADGGALFLCCHAGQIALTRLLFTIETGWVSLQARESGGGSIAASKDLRASLFTAYRHVQDGAPLLMAPDGPWGTQPIEIEVAGIVTNIGEGATFIAFNADVRTIFLNVTRAGDRLIPVIAEGPRRQGDEAYDAYKARWTTFYEAQVRAVFAGAADGIALRSRWARPLSAATSPGD